MKETTSAERASVKDWKLQIHLFEQGPVTSAHVVLDTGDNVLEKRAEAHRNPHDASVPEIGDELAVGRALMSLAQELLNTAVEDVEGMTSMHGADRL